MDRCEEVAKAMFEAPIAGETGYVWPPSHEVDRLWWLGLAGVAIRKCDEWWSHAPEHAGGE